VVAVGQEKATPTHASFGCIGGPALAWFKAGAREDIAMKNKLILGFGMGALLMGAVWAATALGPAIAQTPGRQPTTLETSVGLVAAVRAPSGFKLEMSYSVQDGSSIRSDTVNVSAIEFYPHYIVYHGGGGGYLTVAGSNGSFPWSWGGYAQGEHAHTEQRILPDGTVSPQTVRRVFRHGYDPVQGMATLDFYGRRLTIEEDGRKLRIGDKVLDIPAGQPLDHNEAAFDGNLKLWDLPGPRPVFFVDQVTESSASMSVERSERTRLRRLIP
jgi:hypothetical protein